MPLVNLIQQRKYRLARAEIQAAGRLVGQQHFGFGYQRTRQRHALLFAARQLSGAVRSALSQPHFGQPFPRLLSRLVGIDAANQQRHHHIFKRGKLRQQRRILPNESYMLVPEVGQLLLVQAVQFNVFCARIAHCAAGWLIQAA